MKEEEQKVINTMKVLGLDMIDNAKSGHPGIVLGAAPILYTLYANHLNIDPEKPNHANRDRFVMSCGHGSALLYSTLMLAGFDIDIEEMKKFRRLGSITPGHPELGVTPGVEMTTGPLGQGFATAVGMAIAEKYIAAKINTKENKIINYKTYVMCSDGDLMEGISTEAASLAGTMKLNNLIVLYDSNNICLDGTTSKVFTEKVLDKFKALGWHTEYVKKGNDIRAIDKAIASAKKIKNKPSIIEIKTTIGKGSIYEGTSTVHGKPLDSVDLDKIKQKLEVRDIPFAVSKDSADFFRDKIKERNKLSKRNYNLKIKKATEEQLNLLKKLEEKEIDLNILDKLEVKKEQGRVFGGEVLNALSKENPFLIGGSADLSSSTKTHLNDEEDFTALNYAGKNLNFGVREHSMGAILNGLALSNLKCFGSTFLTFSDYMKPSIRLAALMNLPVVYVFTHDSILIGQDGPTHQPIEQLAMLRSIPNLDLYRPADANEIIGSYREAMKKTDGPSAIVLSRSVLSLQGETKTDISQGGYIVRKEKGNLDAIIISTGKEVENAVMAANNLEAKSLNLRVVSMPNKELFLRQSAKYIESVLPIGKKIIVVEAASSFGWHQFTNSKNIIAIDTFGKSGTGEEVYEEFGFDLKSLTEQIEKSFNKLDINFKMK